MPTLELKHTHIVAADFHDAERILRKISEVVEQPKEFAESGAALYAN